MSGTVVVTEPLIKEVLKAVETIRTPRNQYITRTRIEDEIEETPRNYPILSQATRTFRRQVITKVMKRRYEFWAPERRNTFVWDVTRPAGVAA